MQATNICIQCRNPSSAPSNRLIQDACGHKKCRTCLLDDVDSCKQCLTPSSINTDWDQNVSSDSYKATFAVPQVVPDNHTAVIHCNGKARFSTEKKQEQESNNNIESTGNTENIKKIIDFDKTKAGSKKKVIDIPPHITVLSDPLLYHCTVCSKSFATKCHIKYHKYCKGDLKPYKCEVCSKEFVLQFQYNLHMCKHNNVKPFKCTICTKAFSEKNRLTRHMVLHSSGRNFICPVCAKMFKTKDNLKVHSLTHKTEKSFSCNICKASFSHSSNLKKHLVTHSDEKVHMCDQCGRRFKLKWSLSEHRKSHLSSRPYCCNFCDKSFVYQKDLQRHILIHADTKEFTCGICLTSFRRKDILYRHAKNTHPGKKADIIKNPMNVSELPKKSVVIDNPNAVNVITASPALTKCKADTAQHPTPTISTDSRPTGSVINGPIKLAFKTPAFKSNYNITRGGELIPSTENAPSLSLRESIDLPSCSYSATAEETLHKTLPISSQHPKDSSIINSPSGSIAAPQANLSPYSSVLHYETSFQNRKHALIKNIKFKVPEQYTHLLKSTPGNINNSNNASKISALSDSSVCLQSEPVINRSVIVNNSNSSDIHHWRRRTSQNLVLKN